MHRFGLRVTVAVVAFILGIGANVVVNSFLADRLVQQAEKASQLASATLFWEEPRLIPPTVNSCGHFIVTVAEDHKLYLGTQQMGTLDDPSELTASLNAAFHVRTEFHVYRPGMEATTNIPEDQRIEKTVYIKAPRAMTYGEVSDLIEKLKATGANPIGLVSERPLYRYSWADR